MEVLNDKSFKEKIFDYENHEDWVFIGRRPTIIDFYADWCAPCRAIAPIFERVAEAYKDHVDFYKIDTEASPELASLAGVRGIPSLLFIPMNGELMMSSGVIPEEAFDEAIKEAFGIVLSK